jgi:hypothetical protein
LPRSSPGYYWKGIEMRCFYLIILLAAGILVLGMGITAESLEELGGKPVTVLALDSKGSSARLTFLGEDYEFRLSADSMTDWPATKHLFSRRLKDSLQWVLDWCQDLAFTKTLDLPVFP